MPLEDDQAGVIIRRLTETDIDAAGIISARAFNSTGTRSAEVRRYLQLQPDGWLLALSGGGPVGMVGAVDYGPFAYIGLLAVLPAAQGRGIGRALMRHLLAWLDARGTPVSLLDATDAGAPIYLRLGFEEVARTNVFQPARLDHPPSTSEGVRLLGPSDVPALLRFDAPIFGASREAVFNALLADFPGRAFATWDEAGELTGYLFAQARRLGPWVVRRAQDAETLLHAALALTFDAPPAVLIPAENREAADFMTRAGFEITRYTRFMRRGGFRCPIRREQIGGLASFALG